MTTAIEPFRLPVTSPGDYPDEGRVRLRGEVTAVYGLAKAGAEGWIRDRKYDPVGAFRMVFIEWDVDHWGYNDQKHTWAYEDHFEQVKDETTMANDETNELLRKLLARMGEDTEKNEPKQEVKTDDLDEIEDDQALIDADKFVPATDEEFVETLRAAVKAAKNSAAFLIVAVNRDTEPQSGRPVMIPQIFRSDKDEAAGILLGTQVSYVGHLFHRTVAEDRLADME